MAVPTRPSRGTLTLAVAAAVVVADQLTKTWALHHADPPRHLVGPLWLWLGFNPGAAFGLGRGATPVVETIVIALVIALVVFGRRASRTATWPEAVAMGLLAGGAVGNLSDRLVRGHHGAVVDFIDVAQVGRHQYWPTFNVADSAIVVGAILLALCYLRRSRSASQAAARG